MILPAFEPRGSNMKYVSTSTRLQFFKQHFLYFFPLPQGHGSFLPTLGSDLVTTLGFTNSGSFFLSGLSSFCILSLVGIAVINDTTLKTVGSWQ